MQYVEVPKIWERLPNQPGLFLSGGITNCPDWQKELTSMLTLTNYAVLNPRRKNFPMDDISAAEKQIRWEFEHLRKADIIAFWFCKETVEPIVLFELGTWSALHKKTVIGVEPGYPREMDVYIQMELLGNNLIFSSLKDLAEEIINIEKKIRVPIL